MAQETQQTDHDNIITLIEKVSNLTDEVRLMRDGTKDDIKALQLGKVDRTEFQQYKDDNERIRKEKIDDFTKSDLAFKEEMEKQNKKVDYLLKVVYIGLGALGIIELVAPFFIKYYLHI